VDETTSLAKSEGRSLTHPIRTRDESGRRVVEANASLADGRAMERVGIKDTEPTSSVRVAVGIAVVDAAFVAYITDGLLSAGDAGSHETPLLIWQLIVALAEQFCSPGRYIATETAKAFSGL
jgi:hypothetical protein